jgi:dimethylglycine dehydrogenase
MALRIEKGYGSWGRDYSPEYWPQELGLDGLIKADKPFLNKAAWQAIAAKRPRERLVMLEIEATTADATGNEPVFDREGRGVGRVSSGAYGYHVAKSLALAFLAAEAVVPGTEFDVAILGRPHRARLLDRPPFDPDGMRLRA